MATRCAHCGTPTNRPRFCSDRCRNRGHRRRRAGLPEHSYRNGAHRGPIPLARATRAERQQIVAILAGS